MPPFMEPTEIIESTLLVAGVETKHQEREDGLIILVNLNAHGLFGYPFTMLEPAVAYVTGFVGALMKVPQYPVLKIIKRYSFRR